MYGSVSALLSQRKDFKFSSIFAVCLDTAMSRQDNFFLLVRVCSSLDEIYTLMLILSEPWIFFYFRSVMSFFFLLNIVFILVGFSFFFVLFVGGVLCVYPFTRLLFCLFWAFWVPGSFLAGRVIFS